MGHYDDGRGWNPGGHPRDYPHYPPHPGPHSGGYGHQPHGYHHGHPGYHLGYGYEPSRLGMIIGLAKRHKNWVIGGLFLAFVLACLLFLVVLKIGLALYHSPTTQKLASTTADIGIAAADGAMQKMEVPSDARKKIVREADELKRDVVDRPAQ